MIIKNIYTILKGIIANYIINGHVSKVENQISQLDKAAASVGENAKLRAAQALEVKQKAEQRLAEIAETGRALDRQTKLAANLANALRQSLNVDD